MNKTFEQIEKLKELGFEKQGGFAFTHSDLQMRVNVLELFGTHDAEGHVYKFETYSLRKHKEKYLDNTEMDKMIEKIKVIIEEYKLEEFYQNLDATEFKD